MYSKAHKVLGTWEDSPTAPSRNGSRTPSLRLKSANMSRKGSIISFEHAPPTPEAQSSKGPLHRLLHSRSALTLGLKCRRERNLNSPTAQVGSQLSQWPPNGNYTHAHSPSAPMTSSSRNSSARSSAFHLPFRNQEISNMTRADAQVSSIQSSFQPGPNAFRNKKNLAINPALNPARLSFVSSTGTRSPLLETPILETMFRPQELQDRDRDSTRHPHSRASRFSRDRITSSLKRMFPIESRAAPPSSRVSEDTETNTRIVSLYERNSYDPRTHYFHGFDGDSARLDEDTISIGQAHGHNPMTELNEDDVVGETDNVRYADLDVSVEQPHAITSNDTPDRVRTGKQKPNAHSMMHWKAPDMAEERARSSRESQRHDTAVRDKETILGQSKQSSTHGGTSMLALSDSDDSEDETVVARVKGVKILQSAVKEHLSDVEEEDSIEEDSLQSQYAHVFGNSTQEGPNGHSSTFASSRSTRSNFDDPYRALYESDDQEDSDVTSITSADSLTPPPLSAAHSRPTSAHKAQQALNHDKKEQKQEQVSKSHLAKSSLDEVAPESDSQTMTVTADEYALISSLRRKRATMQKQLMREGYKTAMKEQLAKWEQLRERAFSDLEAKAELESKDSSKRPARRPSLPSSPKKRPQHHRSGTLSDLPSARKRAKSNEDIPDLPLPVPARISKVATAQVVDVKGACVIKAGRIQNEKEMEDEKTVKFEKAIEASSQFSESKAEKPKPLFIPSTPKQVGQTQINAAPLAQGRTQPSSPPTPEDKMRASWAMVNLELQQNKFPMRPSKMLTRKSSKGKISEKNFDSAGNKINISATPATLSDKGSSSDMSSFTTIEKEEATDYRPSNILAQERLEGTMKSMLESAVVLPRTATTVNPSINGIGKDTSSAGYESGSTLSRLSPMPTNEKRTTMIFSPSKDSHDTEKSLDASITPMAEAARPQKTCNSARWSQYDDGHESIDEDEILLMLDDAVSNTEFASPNRTSESQIGMAYEPDSFIIPTSTAGRLKGAASNFPPRNDPPPPAPVQIPSMPAVRTNFSVPTPPRSRQHSVSYVASNAQPPPQQQHSKGSKIPIASGLPRAIHHSHVQSFSRPRPASPSVLVQTQDYRSSPVPHNRHIPSVKSSFSTPTGGRSRNGSTSGAAIVNEVFRGWGES